MLSAHDFKNINDIEDPDEAYKVFLNEYDELYNIACPLLTVKQSRKEPWMTAGLLISSKNKNKLMINKIRKPTEPNILTYKKYVEIYNRLIRAAKKSHYHNIFREYISDSKRTWKIINESIKKIIINLSRLTNI